MVWFKVDDGLAFHHKVISAGNSAMGLWVRAGSWSAQQLTNGYIPDHMVPVLGTAAQARRLVRAGLWTEADGGYQFHDWTENDRNPTRDETILRRKRDSERQHRKREKKRSDHEKSQDTTGSPPVTPPASHTGRHGGCPDPPARPVLSSPPERVQAPPEQAESKIDTPTLVAVWIDSFQAATGRNPTGSMRAQAGKEIKRLLSQPGDPQLVAQAAREAGSKGYPTVDREHGPLVAAQRRPQRTYPAWMDYAEQ